MPKKQRLPQVQFKDPDLLFAIARARHPGEFDDPKVEKVREKFDKEYTEWGDYGRFEIDPATLQARLLPRKEWR